MPIPEKFHKLLRWSRSGREITPRMLAAGLLACFLIAVALRIYVWHVEPVPSRDGVNYIRRAWELREQRSGCCPGKLYPPVLPTPHYLYSAYLSLNLFSLTPGILGVSTNILLGSLLTFLIGGISWLLWKRKDLVLICALLAAVFPPWVDWSIEIQREMPHLFFNCCFFLSLLLYWRKKSQYWCAAAMGGFSAFSLITRYEGGEIVLLSLALFAYLLWKSPSKLKILLHGAVMFAVMFSVLLLISSAAGFSPLFFGEYFCQKAAGLIP